MNNLKVYDGLYAALNEKKSSETARRIAYGGQALGEYSKYRAVYINFKFASKKTVLYFAMGKLSHTDLNCQ
jgi:hypothetical protein